MEPVTTTISSAAADSKGQSAGAVAVAPWCGRTVSKNWSLASRIPDVLLHFIDEFVGESPREIVHEHCSGSSQFRALRRGQTLSSFEPSILAYRADAALHDALEVVNGDVTALDLNSQIMIRNNRSLFRTLDFTDMDMTGQKFTAIMALLSADNKPTDIEAILYAPNSVHDDSINALVAHQHKLPKLQALQVLTTCYDLGHFFTAEGERLISESTLAPQLKHFGVKKTVPNTMKQLVSLDTDAEYLNRSKDEPLQGITNYYGRAAITSRVFAVTLPRLAHISYKHERRSVTQYTGDSLCFAQAWQHVQTCSLRIAPAELGFQGFARLGQLQHREKIRRIELYSAFVSDDQLTAIATHVPGLEVLTIGSGCNVNTSRPPTKATYMNFQSLRELSFVEKVAVYPATSPCLIGTNVFEWVTRDPEIIETICGLPKLRRLTLALPTLDALAKYPSLEKLDEVILVIPDADRRARKTIRVVGADIPHLLGQQPLWQSMQGLKIT